MVIRCFKFVESYTDQFPAVEVFLSSKYGGCREAKMVRLAVLEKYRRDITRTRSKVRIVSTRVEHKQIMRLAPKLWSYGKSYCHFHDATQVLELMT